MTRVNSRGIHAAWCAAGVLLLCAPRPARAATGTDGPADVAAIERSFVDVADRVGPAVVSIVATTTVVQRLTPWGDEFMDDFFRQFFDAPQQRERRQDMMSAGSGVIVSTDGTILTNAHVVGRARKVMVHLLDRKEYEAKIVGQDEDTDLAVLKIKADGKLIAAPLGDSDKIRVGQWAIAIGNPFALENTMTVGVVSAKGRKLNDETGRSARFTSFIQTDASINKGNSGGPLLNIRGEVIGINSMIFSPSGGSVGIGFAIPVNIARTVMAGLLKEGRIVRPQLGVAYRPLAAEVRRKLKLPEGVGMEVSGVLKGTAADKAGILPGDILLSVDRKPLKESDDLRTAVLNHKVGDGLALEVYRKGVRRTVQVMLREQSDSTPAAAAGPAGRKQDGASASWLGMTVAELTPEIAGQLEARDEQGVVVTGLEPDSPAFNAGVQRGDIIREVEQNPVVNIAAFDSARKAVGDKGSVLLLVERRGSTMYVVVDRGAKAPQE